MTTENSVAPRTTISEPSTSLARSALPAPVLLLLLLPLVCEIAVPDTVAEGLPMLVDVAAAVVALAKLTLFEAD